MRANFVTVLPPATFLSLSLSLCVASAQLLEQEELKREDVLSERDEALAQVCVMHAAHVSYHASTGGTARLLARAVVIAKQLRSFVDERQGAETRDEAERGTLHFCGRSIARHHHYRLFVDHAD